MRDAPWAPCWHPPHIAGVYSSGIDHIGFRPDNVVALRTTAAVPLLRVKPGQGDVTTYICQNFACQAPLVGAEWRRR